MEQQSTSLPQITKAGADLQAKNRPITHADSGVCRVERPIRGLYVHIPFCFHKCHYCDFYSIVDNQDRMDAFTARLIGELEASRQWLTEPVETIFVGGGTPTLMPPANWERLLEALWTVVTPSAEIEFTVEANPETITPELAVTLAGGGVNRMSVGAQSFNPAHLKALERWHDPANVGRAIDLARAAGIESVSIDMIFGIPGQTVESWVSDLEMALSLQTDHLSCYGLIYEPNTPMRSRRDRGEIKAIDEATEAAMYQATCSMLRQAGHEQYEISNWARPGHQCRHNLLYWSNENWWPVGPSGSGHVDGLRWRNTPRLGAYLDGMGLSDVIDVERLDADGQVGEILMLGFRLRGGISEVELERQLLRGVRGDARRAVIDEALASGLLERCDAAVRLTDRGLLLADGLLAELV